MLACFGYKSEVSFIYRVIALALYEHVFLLRGDTPSSHVEAQIARFSALIEEQGGKVGRVEQWGLRSLAYPINRNRKAYYTLMNIVSERPAIDEMERQMKLDDQVIRFMTIRVHAHDDEPSPMTKLREGVRKGTPGRSDSESAPQEPGTGAHRARADRAPSHKKSTQEVRS